MKRHNFLAKLHSIYLQISMNYPTLMQITYRIDNGTNNSLGLLLSIYLLFTNFLIQLTSRKVLKNKINTLLLNVTVVKLYDIGMTYILHDIDLSLKQDFLLFIHLLPILILTVLLDDFDSNNLACLLLSPFYNFREAASKLWLDYSPMVSF